MTNAEMMIVNLYCDYRLHAQIANIAIDKADEAGNEKELEKAYARQSEAVRAANRLLYEVICHMDAHEVISCIEVWNKANEDNYDGTSTDVLREVDVPDEIYAKIINRPSRFD